MAKRHADAEAVVEKVLERHDPDPADGDSDPSGDPTYEFQLNPASLPADLHPIHVHKDDKAKYKGLGYREVRGAEGIQFLSGLEVGSDELMTVRDHELMVCDKERHTKREARERKSNTEVRARFLRNSARGDIFVSSGGSGPRAMGNVRSSVRS